jgi:crotonobetainyl-CoA:carnitine CoA-transferase CaiB-like acyl-CoA transferase
MHEDPQTLARGMVVEVEHARAGRMRTLGLPVKFSGTPGAVATGAPLLGEHSRAILREHGYTDAQVEALVEAGVVAGG